MAKKLYVGNMSYDTTEEKLREVFGEFGTVTEVMIIPDRETGKPKGFCFVTIEEDDGAQKAIDAFSDGEKEIDGRALKVNEARPREER